MDRRHFLTGMMASLTLLQSKPRWSTFNAHDYRVIALWNGFPLDGGSPSDEATLSAKKGVYKTSLLPR